jgi:hypothetical protein
MYNGSFLEIYFVIFEKKHHPLIDLHPLPLPSNSGRVNQLARSLLTRQPKIPSTAYNHMMSKLCRWGLSKAVEDSFYEVTLEDLVKRRPKPYPRLNKPRRQARIEIEKYGHAKKLRA